MPRKGALVSLLAATMLVAAPLVEGQPPCDGEYLRELATLALRPVFGQQPFRQLDKAGIQRLAVCRNGVAAVEQRDVVQHFLPSRNQLGRETLQSFGSQSAAGQLNPLPVVLQKRSGFRSHVHPL